MKPETCDCGSTEFREKLWGYVCNECSKFHPNSKEDAEKQWAYGIGPGSLAGDDRDL